MENTVCLKADSGEKSVLAGSELGYKIFAICIVCKRDLWYLCCC